MNTLRNYLMGIQDRDYYWEHRDKLEKRSKPKFKYSYKEDELGELRVQKTKVLNSKNYKTQLTKFFQKTIKKLIFFLILISLTMILTFTGTMIVLIKTPEFLETPYLFLKYLFRL